MLRLFAVFLALLLAVSAAGAATSGKAAVSGREGYDPIPRLTPSKPGPLTLANVYCLTFPPGRRPGYPPQPSPDRNNIFIFDHTLGLSIAQVSAISAVHHFDGRVTAPQNVPFAWSGD